MSEAGSSVPPEGNPKDRHEPRGRKPNDHLPPSRAREVQRAFRLRRAEHLASLEERILGLENENNQLRALLSLPEGDRTRIGSGPTGRGKTLKEGGVPMSERVRARKEARERDRKARGLPDASTSESEREGRESATLSPGPVSGLGRGEANLLASSTSASSSNLPLYSPPSTENNANNYNFMSLPPFMGNPVSPNTQFPDFMSNLDSSMFKSPSPALSAPNFGLFNMFDNASNSGLPESDPAPLSPLPGPILSSSAKSNNPVSPASQPDILTRLRACCHVSDSHVVNDPGLLIFATRLCQTFPCSYGGVHPNPATQTDSDHMLLDDSWRALRSQLDPGGEADGENRINTGRMAAELVIRAAASRGGASGGWIMCRYREGMSVKRIIISGLVAGFGGHLD